MTRSFPVVVQVLALAALGLVAGAVHSHFKPVHLRLAEPQAVPISPQDQPHQARPQPSPAPAPGVQPPGAAVTPSAPVVGAPAQAPAAEATPLGLHITIAQAKALYDQGVTFIDARTDREYAAGAIVGAHHITPATFSRPESTEKLRFIDPAQPLVVYCGGGDCHDSENLVILLQQSGYTSPHIMTEGFPAWKAAGYDVEIPAAEGGAGGGL